jgi:hypothetical protein
MRTVALVGMVVLAALVLMVGCTTTEEEKQAGYPYDTNYCIETQSYLPVNDPHFQKAPGAAKPVEAAQPAATAAPKPATAPKTGGTTPAGGAATK